MPALNAVEEPMQAFWTASAVLVGLAFVSMVGVVIAIMIGQL